MWRYKGNGQEFLPGIPARDLTDEEAGEWPDVKISPLYEHVEEQKPITGRKVKSSG